MQCFLLKSFNLSYLFKKGKGYKARFATYEMQISTLDGTLMTVKFVWKVFMNGYCLLVFHCHQQMRELHNDVNCVMMSILIAD